MKKSSLPANKTDRPVQFRMQDAQRIASVVHTVESGRRQPKGSRLPRAFSGGGGRIRLCKTPCEFKKGTSLDLDVWEGPGDTKTTPTETIKGVSNKYADIGSGKYVSVAMHGNGTWYLISAECG